MRSSFCTAGSRWTWDPSETLCCQSSRTGKACTQSTCWTLWVTGKLRWPLTHSPSHAQVTRIKVSLFVCVQSAAGDSARCWGTVFILLQVPSDRNHHPAGSCWGGASRTPVSTATGTDTATTSLWRHMMSHGPGGADPSLNVHSVPVQTCGPQTCFCVEPAEPQLSRRVQLDCDVAGISIRASLRFKYLLNVA